jgi:hypothetical protein
MENGKERRGLPHEAVVDRVEPWLPKAVVNRVDPWL